MELLAHLAGAFAVAALLVHVATSLSAAWRCRRAIEFRGKAAQRPPVTIIRPLCGLDAFEEATLHSTFQLDYPQLEILLCCASATDPVVPLARRMIAEHPHVQARLLIGEDRVSDNPKLNNVIKGWRAASHGWIVITDSNVLLPHDYIDRLFETWKPGTGLVSAPPIGARPANAWAELECAFLNGYQARWQFAADSLGFGFAQGKTLFWRRIDLERAGGIHALGAELAEDAASTKLVREQGLRVRLVDGAFPQPLGFRALPSVWSRQLRWARLRRATFPLVYALEIFSGLFAPLGACLFAAWILDLPEAADRRPVRRHLARFRVWARRYRRLAAVMARAAAVAAARSAAARAVGAILARQRSELARQRHERRRPRLQRSHRLAPPSLETHCHPGLSATQGAVAAGAPGSAMRGSLRARLKSATERGAEKPRIATCSSVSPSRSTPARSSTSALTMSWHCLSLVSASRRLAALTVLPITVTEAVSA